MLTVHSAILVASIMENYIYLISVVNFKILSLTFFSWTTRCLFKQTKTIMTSLMYVKRILLSLENFVSWAACECYCHIAEETNKWSFALTSCIMWNVHKENPAVGEYFNLWTKKLLELLLLTRGGSLSLWRVRWGFWSTRLNCCIKDL